MKLFREKIKTGTRRNVILPALAVILACTVVLAGNLVYEYHIGSASAASGPGGPYLRYDNNGAVVSISVNWVDTGGGSTIHWAEDVVPSGGDLNWHTSGMTVSGLGTSQAIAVLSAAEKYKNYYFKVVKDGETYILRAFPANFNGVGGPRYSNNSAHNNYQADTSMCANCHSTHSGLKAKLLTQPTYYELCLLCHGNSTTQSKYDVEMGKVYTGVSWVDSLAGPIGTGMGTSMHNIDDRNNVDTTVYGSDPNQFLTFTCLSCHNVHGGTDDNYRLIKKTIYPANNNSNPQTVNYNAYSVVNNIALGEEVYFVSGNSEFCAACHLDYAKGNAREKGGSFRNFYRHPVTVGTEVYSVYSTSPLKDLYPNSGDSLPLQYYGAGESKTADKRTAVVCETCHFAHGTTKNFNISYPPDGTTVTNQKMLRLDNYGSCQSCHKK